MRRPAYVVEPREMLTVEGVQITPDDFPRSGPLRTLHGPRHGQGGRQLQSRGRALRGAVREVRSAVPGHPEVRRLALTLAGRQLEPDSALSEDEARRVRLRRLTGLTSSGFVGCSRRISGLAFRPLAVSCIPRTLETGPEPSEGRRVLANTLNESDLTLVQWVLANALVDPIRRPRILYIYGSEGGEGKTVAINTITSCLPGICTTMFRDLLGDPRARLTEDEKCNLLRYRIVTYGDVQLRDGKLNTSVWKDLGSDDAVAIGRGRGRLNVTCVVASNYLWYQKSSYAKRWFARRTLAIRLHSPALGCPVPPQAFTDLQCCKFALECIRTRLKYSDPPAPPRTLLLTLLGHRAPVATRGVVEDEGVCFLLALTATYSVAIAAQMDVNKLVDLVASASASAVLTLGGLRAIAGIRPSLL